jgi:hypothetical protein
MEHPTTFEHDNPDLDVMRTVQRLKSLYDGDRVVNEVVGMGRRAIPALRAAWRDPTGLFHIRRNVVDALVALEAYHVLAEFLRFDRRIEDPVERLGEEAVINAAARGLSCCKEEWVYELLFELAKRRRLSGVICALGSFRRPETVPLLIEALGEDEVRLTAEAIIIAIGHPSRSALVDSANCRDPSSHNESESSLRRRRQQF